MRKEIELNKSQERNLNKVRLKALKHQEKRDYLKDDPAFSEEINQMIAKQEVKKNQTEKVVETKNKESKSFNEIFNDSKAKTALFFTNISNNSKKFIAESKSKLDAKKQELSKKKEENAKIKQEKAEAKALAAKQAKEAKEAEKLKETENTKEAIVAPTAVATTNDNKKEVEENKEKKKFALFAKNPNKVKKVKEARPKGKTVTFVFAILMCLFLLACLAAGIGALVFANKLLEDKPTLNVDDLKAPDSSIIFDNQGNKVIELGMYLRENIPYQEMPNSLIDAFLAIEDSRFFEHPGFDIPRFTKAAIENIKTRDFSQGGSTITMQLIKNTYYSIDADSDSTIAAREGMSGIKRKMQEIVLALELELKTEVTKQEIIAMYINKVNYGNNIRGVQKAAQYYFGKDAKDLNLSESAFLAGLINSPNNYNPYNDLYKYDNYYLDPDHEYLENGTLRRDEVIDLMLMHGYVNEKEAALAKSVRLEDLLVGENVTFSSMNDKYQSYIDAVIDEVIETTGESPYEVGMKIYTNMNAYLQEYIYDMQNEADYIGIYFPNELCQSAIVVMDNNRYRVSVSIVSNCLKLIEEYYDGLGVAYYVRTISVQSEFYNYLIDKEKEFNSSNKNMYESINNTILKKYMEEL